MSATNVNTVYKHKLQTTYVLASTSWVQHHSPRLSNATLCTIIGYEPADLTVHPPPPRTAEGGFIFFV